VKRAKKKKKTVKKTSTEPKRTEKAEKAEEKTEEKTEEKNKEKSSVVNPQLILPKNWKGRIFPRGHGQEIIPNLFLGSHLAAQNKKALQELGITHVLACHGRAPLFPDDFKYMVLYLNDNDDQQDLTSYFSTTNLFLENVITAKEAVLVHCVRGVSRSATVVMAYLISKGMEPSAAKQLMQRSRPQACPRPGFITQLKTYHDELSRGVFTTQFKSKPWIAVSEPKKAKKANKSS